MITLTIIGLGQRGASLGLALKRRQNFEAQIIGHDLYLEVAKQAQTLGAVDKAEWNLPASCEQADVIFLCVPLAALREVMGQVSQVTKEGAVIAALSILQAPVLEWANEKLPGRHVVGVAPALNPNYLHDDTAEARAELFDQGLWALVAGADTDPDALKLMGGLAQLAGAVPFFIGADEYDALSTGVNLLPALSAASLLLAAGKSSAWTDARKIADRNLATGTAALFDGASLAHGLILNQTNAVSDLDGLLGQLKVLRDLIAAGDEAKLNALLTEAAEVRRTWLEKRRAANWLAEEVKLPEIPQMGDMLKQMVGFGRKK